MKRLLLLSLSIALLSGAPAQATFSDTVDSITDATKTVALVAGVVGGVYCLARGYNAVTYKLALKRFGTELSLLDRYKSVWSEKDFVKNLHRSITIKHEYLPWYIYESTYRNYPLLKYKNDLDRYISSLWLSQILYLSASGRAQIRDLVDKLCKLRDYVIMNPGYFKERRCFEEKK